MSCYLLDDEGWLCLFDARQVSDLPKNSPVHQVYDLSGVGDPFYLANTFRQVKDLPRIGVAEPQEKARTVKASGPDQPQLLETRGSRGERSFRQPGNRTVGFDNVFQC